MNKNRWLASLALVLSTLTGAQAASDAEVEAVTMPVWLVRDGNRMPLAPGARLRNGDALDTGPGARTRLRLADGSTVKLGEKARFTLGGMTVGGADQVFRASLGVVEGAFRFTTATLDRFRGKREVQVRFSTVTAGIRGTDLWGKSLPEREIVALIEGRIEITRAGEAPVTMDRPKTWYQAPRNAPAVGVQPLADDLLGRFAQETEIAPDSVSVSRSGRWRLVVLASALESEAQAAYDRLAEAGYPVALQPLRGAQQGRYRVLVDGFDDEATAAELGRRLETRFGFHQTSVSRR